MTGCPWHRNQMMRTVLIEWGRKGKKTTRQNCFHLTLLFRLLGGVGAGDVGGVVCLFILCKYWLAASSLWGLTHPSGPVKAVMFGGRVWGRVWQLLSCCTTPGLPDLPALGLVAGRWSLLWGGSGSQAAACPRYWLEVSLHPGSLVIVLRWLRLPGRQASNLLYGRMVLNRALWLFIYFCLCVAVLPCHWNRARRGCSVVWWE